MIAFYSVHSITRELVVTMCHCFTTLARNLSDLPSILCCSSRRASSSNHRNARHKPSTQLPSPSSAAHTHCIDIRCRGPTPRTPHSRSSANRNALDTKLARDHAGDHFLCHGAACLCYDCACASAQRQMQALQLLRHHSPCRCTTRPPAQPDSREAAAAGRSFWGSQPPCWA